MAPVGAEHAVKRRPHELDHQKQRDQAHDPCGQPGALQPRGLKPDPSFLNIPRDGEGDQKADVSVAVVHHFLRVHQQLSVHIVHGVGLEGDVGNAQPADDEADEQEEVFLLRVLIQIREDLRDDDQPEHGFAYAHKNILGCVHAQIVPREGREQQENTQNHGDEFLPGPGHHGQAPVDRPRRDGVAAGERIAGSGGDGISGRVHAGIPDPGAVGADRQLHDGVEAAAQVVGNQRVQALPLADHPVDKDRDHDQIGHGKERDPLHERRQRVVDRFSEALKKQQVFNIHFSLYLLFLLFLQSSQILGQRAADDGNVKLFPQRRQTLVICSSGRSFARHSWQASGQCWTFSGRVNVFPQYLHVLVTVPGVSARGAEMPAAVCGSFPKNSFFISNNRCPPPDNPPGARTVSVQAFFLRGCRTYGSLPFH